MRVRGRFSRTYISTVFVGGGVGTHHCIRRHALSRVALFAHKQAKGIVDTGTFEETRPKDLWEKTIYHLVESGNGWANYAVEHPGAWLHEGIERSSYQPVLVAA